LFEKIIKTAYCTKEFITAVKSFKIQGPGLAPFRKNLAGTNTLAYFVTPIITKRKSLVTLTPGPNAIKLFLSVIYVFL
jgi:hypothetical protein